MGKGSSQYEPTLQANKNLFISIPEGVGSTGLRPACEVRGGHYSLLEALILLEFLSQAGHLGLARAWMSTGSSRSRWANSRGEDLERFLARSVHEERDIAVMFSQHRVDWVGVCVDVARHVANSDGFCGGRSLVLWFSEVRFIEVAGYPAAVFGQRSICLGSCGLGSASLL